MKMENEIKLNIEIKDGKFSFTYVVGTSRHTGTMNLCADSLVRFTHLLDICSSAYKFSDKEWEREAIAKAYLEKKKE